MAREIVDDSVFLIVRQQRPEETRFTPSALHPQLTTHTWPEGHDTNPRDYNKYIVPLVNNLSSYFRRNNLGPLFLRQLERKIRAPLADGYVKRIRT